jgi:hypothetical protein
MIKLHFDVRDIFRVVRLGWSGKKIWVGMCGILAAYLGYSILVTLSHLSAGMSLGQVWHRYGLFPGAAPGSHPLLGTILDLSAMVYALMVVFLTLCMICKITFQQLRGDDFYSSGDAWGFLKKNWSGVVFGPVAALAILVFFIIVGIVIGLVAKWIPVVGELLFAVSFIPIFFAALVAVFVALAFVVAFMMSPAIVGTVGEDALEVVIQSFSLAWSQPWRLILYTAWMNISVWVGVTILGSFMSAALALVSWACGWFMKEKLANMILVAEQYAPYDFTRCEWLDIDIQDCLPVPGTPSGSEAWAGRLLAVMLILLTGVITSYMMSAHASGTSLIYVILRKRKDDENLLEWEDENIDDEPDAFTENSEEETSDTGDAGSAVESSEEDKGEGGQ